MSAPFTPGSGAKLGVFGRSSSADVANDLWGGVVVGYWNGTDFVPVDTAALTGPVAETAPASDTASSGLNGRLQRIAQRITSLITALGSPFQAGGTIGNTAFGISGTLPAFAATPTFNIGTAPTITITGVVTANVGSGTQAISAATLPALSGTTAVSLATLPALAPGSALIGKVGIDQTTPGTTNKVSLGTDVVAVAPKAVADVTVASGSIDPTTLNSTFSVTPNGNGTVTLKIGTLGSTFAGGAVVTFEKVGVTGSTAIATNVFPRGAANSGRIKSTTVGGEFIFASEGAVSVQARISTIGTGGTIPVSVQMAAPPAVQPVTPVNIGQTTRLWSESASQKIVTSSTAASSSAIAASEVEIHAAGAALWYARGPAPTATTGAGSRRLAADDRTVIQINPGELLSFIQDTTAGYAVVTPVA